MGKVVAFSGVGNTGKSSIIKKIKSMYENDYPTFYLGEIARDALQQVGREDIGKFQQLIFDMEAQRVERIQKYRDDYAIILVDRTRVDQLAYLNFLQLTGKIDTPVQQHSLPTDIYDYVLYMTTPIKQSTKYEEYNDHRLTWIMNAVIYSAFHEHNNVHTFSNAMEDHARIMDFIQFKLP